jgi:hypothetical protein
MTLYWNVRQDILEIAHSWPAIFFAFLLGSLLGWGVSYILPTSYRAESGLYVAYNADAIYRNPDDYKNWQLGELEAFIVTDPVLDGTLHKLRVQDPYWDAVSAEDLRTQIHSYWRNAGKWRLVAETEEPQRATQLVRAWKDTIIEQVSGATTSAAIMLDLNAQIAAVAAEKVRLGLHTEEITGVRDALQTWRNEHGGGGGTAPLTTLDRWQLQTIAARAAKVNSAAVSLIDQIPSADAPANDYMSWVDQIIIVFENELAILERQLGEIEVGGEELQTKLIEASDAAHELTVFLIVEPLSDDLSSAQPVRLSSQMALVGGVLGVLLWGFIWLGRPMRKAKT